MFSGCLINAVAVIWTWCGRCWLVSKYKLLAEWRWTFKKSDLFFEGDWFSFLVCVTLGECLQTSQWKLAWILGNQSNHKRLLVQHYTPHLVPLVPGTTWQHCSLPYLGLWLPDGHWLDSSHVELHLKSRGYFQASIIVNSSDHAQCCWPTLCCCWLKKKKEQRRKAC